MKRKQYILLILATVLCGFSAWTFSETSGGYSEKHTQIVLRDIGHQLLLHAHDSTSRVLPVKKVEENTYQISFESSFKFVPDTLVAIVDKHFKANNLQGDYIVNVLNCTTNNLIFGYEVSSKNKNLLPCLGRTQAKDCYVIQIDFLNASKSSYFWLLTLPIGLFLFYFIKNQTPEKALPISSEQDFVKIGAFEYVPLKSHLKLKKEIFELSKHENKLLELLNLQANEVVDREFLINEIWEKDGVIVTSRSLDVLVSKLRKKLSADPKLQIINSHGKGYKLTIE
jgi:hypothetical protein